VMDGLDQTSVNAAVTAARPEVIVHQMTALATVSDLRHFDRRFALTNRLRCEGTRYLLDAAARIGCSPGRRAPTQAPGSGQRSWVMVVHPRR
jgi:hypothetical protein